MAPIIVGIKEFRNNMATITKNALKKNRHILVLSRNKPILSVYPLTDDDGEDVYDKKFMKDIEEARKDVRAGRVYDSTQARKMLGV